MNKIYKSIDDIKLSDKDKKRIYDNILEQSNNRKSVFGFGSVFRFAIIMIAIGVFSVGSVYAMAKIFNWDDKFLDFFDFGQEEAQQYNLEISQINKSIQIDDMNVTIKQATIFDRTVYFLLDVKFDEPNELLDIENNDDIPEVLCGIKLTKANDKYYGNFQYVKVNDEKTNVIVVASINVDENIEKGDDFSISILTDYIENINLDGSAVGECKNEHQVDWIVDTNSNNKKVVHNFDEKYYLKNNEDIKMYPTKMTISPIEIKLELMVETKTELSELSEYNLKFDDNIIVNFNDGGVIKLNSIDKNGKYAQGTDMWSYEEGVDDADAKHMTLVWDNLFSFHDFSNIEFSIIDVNNIKNIQIGDNVFEIAF